MKKKNGFTLVELLAVIVILAIIALIAIPLIGNVIEKAKIGALESSVNGLVESANMYYANNTIKGETIAETIFDFENGKQISDKKLEYKGKVYNGKLILHANGEVAVCIDDEEHYAYKNKDRDEIVSGNGTCLYDGTTGDFSSNTENSGVYKVGSVDGINTTFDIKAILPNIDYTSLTTSNFVFACTSANGGGPDANNDADAKWHPRNSGTIGLSYDNTTGILTVNAYFGTSGSTSFTKFTGNVLLILGEIK